MSDDPDTSTPTLAVVADLPPVADEHHDVSEYPLVLLHAFPLDGSMWDAVVTELERRRGARPRVLVLDSPGFGRSAPFHGVDPGLDPIAAAAVNTVRSHTGQDKALWAGCSMGGYVAMAIADKHPDAVAGLGLFNTRSTADTDASRATRLDAAARLDHASSVSDPRAIALGMVAARGGGRGKALETASDIIGRQRPSAMAWAQRAMATRPDRTEVLRESGVPAIVVWGRQDRMMSFAEAENMAAALGVEVSTNGVGHLSPIEAPTAVQRALMQLARDAA
jgi:pimeloyl-ACP methyl ester carboxylesterase